MVSFVTLCWISLSPADAYSVSLESLSSFTAPHIDLCDDLCLFYWKLCDIVHGGHIPYEIQDEESYIMANLCIRNVPLYGAQVQNTVQ